MRRSGGATRAAGSAARVHVSARAKGETTAAATIVAAAAATEALQSAAHRAAAGVCLLRRWAKGVVDAGGRGSGVALAGERAAGLQV